MVQRLADPPPATRRLERRRHAGERCAATPRVAEEAFEFWAGRLVYKRVLRAMAEQARSRGLDFAYGSRRGPFSVKLAVRVAGDSGAVTGFGRFARGLLELYAPVAPAL